MNRTQVIPSRSLYVFIGRMLEVKRNLQYIVTAISIKLRLGSPKPVLDALEEPSKECDLLAND